MLSLILVLSTLLIFSFVVAVRAKRRDDRDEFRGPKAADVEIERELARRGEDQA